MANAKTSSMKNEESLKPIAYIVSSSASHKSTRIGTESGAIDLAKRLLEIEMIKLRSNGPGEKPIDREIKIEIEAVFRGHATRDEESEKYLAEIKREINEKAEAAAKEKAAEGKNAETSVDSSEQSEVAP